MKMNSRNGRRAFRRGVAIGAACLACAALRAGAQDQNQYQGGPAAAEQGAQYQQDGKTEKFVQKALRGSQIEVEMGQLAQQKAQNQQVKDLAASMARDHSQANQKLEQLAAKLNVRADKRAWDAKHQKALDHLRSQSGAEFDKAFVTHAIKDHKKDIAEFEKCQKEANNPELQAFIQETLPKLRQHLRMAQAAATAVGVDEAAIAAESEDDADATGVGAPAPGVSGEKDTLQDNGARNAPRGSLDRPAEQDPGGAINRNNAAIAADAQAQIGDRTFEAELNVNEPDANVQSKSETKPDDAEDDDSSENKLFQKGDGKILGLSTSKTDGKILGLFPAPGARNRDRELSATSETEVETSVGAPTPGETGRSSLETRIPFNEAPRSVRQALRDEGLGGETIQLKKLTVYEAEVNGKKVHVTEDGTVYRHAVENENRSNR